MAQLPYTEDQLSAAQQQIRAAIVAAAAQHERITYTDICSRITAIQLCARSPLLAHLLACILTDENKPSGSGVAITAVVVNKVKTCQAVTKTRASGSTRDRPALPSTTR